ncbi:hypothetical protein B0H19DRAFT_1242981 [Mycena capillaripes]|nr:hypothetical protein B0H19DRAFT_1242981 [Mycena capillaripes]
MRFVPFLLALFALPYVHSAPSTAAPDVRPVLAKDIDLSGKVAVPVTIVNELGNATMFTFDGQSTLEVLTPYYRGFDFQHPVDRFEVNNDAWIFKNRGTRQWLKVNVENEHLITVSDFSPTIFAVEHAGGGQLVIKLQYEDKVWEPVYDGASMLYTRVMLRPASGSASQHWTYRAGISDIA